MNFICFKHDLRNLVYDYEIEIRNVAFEEFYVVVIMFSS